MPVGKHSGENPRSCVIRKKKMDETGFASAILRQEAHALALMAHGLNTSFCEVVDCLYETGRIVVTGMGKSGHVVRKMASTGSLACFIHPGEARHSDLGMLTTGKPANIRKDQPVGNGQRAAKSQSSGQRAHLSVRMRYLFRLRQSGDGQARAGNDEAFRRTVIFDITHSGQLPGALGDCSGGQREFMPVPPARWTKPPAMAPTCWRYTTSPPCWNSARRLTGWPGKRRRFRHESRRRHFCALWIDASARQAFAGYLRQAADATCSGSVNTFPYTA